MLVYVDDIIILGRLPKVIKFTVDSQSRLYEGRHSVSFEWFFAVKL